MLQYTSDDVYILESFPATELSRRWRPEGTSGVYLWSDEIVEHSDDMPVTGNGFLKKTDAQNPESRRCESALVLHRSKRMRGSTENAVASISLSDR